MGTQLGERKGKIFTNQTERDRFLALFRQEVDRRRQGETHRQREGC
jgi:hypothetical protein